LGLSVSLDSEAPIWSAPPRSAFGDFCMRGGAFVVRRVTTGTRAQGESAASHARIVKCGKGRRTPNKRRAVQVADPYFGLRRPVPHSVTLHAWRRFCSGPETIGTRAQGESAATNARIGKCGNGRRSPNKRHAAEAGGVEFRGAKSDLSADRFHAAITFISRSVLVGFRSEYQACGIPGLSSNGWRARLCLEPQPAVAINAVRVTR